MGFWAKMLSSTLPTWYPFSSSSSTTWSRSFRLSAPAVPITDTVKRSENGLAVETVDRSTLFAVQTPQVFQADLIRAAVQKALEDGEVLTDDCAAVERLGMKVSLTRGSRENLKLTTPFDLIVGEASLDARERGELG